MTSKYKRRELEKQRIRLGDEDPETIRREALDRSHPQVRVCIECGLPGDPRDFERWAPACKRCGGTEPKPAKHAPLTSKPAPAPKPRPAPSGRVGRRHSGRNLNGKVGSGRGH